MEAHVLFGIGCLSGLMIGVVCGIQLGFEKACRIHEAGEDRE